MKNDRFPSTVFSDRNIGLAISRVRKPDAAKLGRPGARWELAHNFTGGRHARKHPATGRPGPSVRGFSTLSGGNSKFPEYRALDPARWVSWTGSDGRWRAGRQLHMPRADLFDRLERKRQAADAYRLALELDAPETGPVFIARRLRRLAAT